MNKKTITTVGLGAVILLCLFRYVFFNYFTNHLDEMQKKCVEHVSGVAFNVLADSLEYVSTKIELFEFDDFDTDLENIPKREIISQLSLFKNSFYYVSSIYLALENGQYYESSTTSTDTLGTENQEWFYKTRKNLKTNFIPLKKNNNTINAIVATPFYYRGEYVGVIAAEIDSSLLNKITDYFGNDVSQLVISDKNNNALFILDKSFEDDGNYNKYESSYSYLTHNSKELTQFKVSVYSLKAGNNSTFIFSSWIFSIIFILIIGYTIWSKWKNYKEFTAGLFTLQVIIIMFAEIAACFTFYYRSYNEHINHHLNILSKYQEQMELNAKYTAETVWTKVQEEKIFKTNALINNDEEAYRKIMDIYNSVSNINNHYINFFWISKDGEYQNFPYNSTHVAKDYNFQINRRLLNGSDRNTYTISEDMENWLLKEYVFKIKDDRNNYIGTFGINLEYDVPEKSIAKYFQSENLNSYFEYRDGIITKIDGDESIVLDSTRLSNLEISKINDNQTGIINIKVDGKKQTFAYYTTLKENTKRLIPARIDNGDSKILFIVCIIVAIFEILISLFLAIKEKTEITVYENFEENYELKLINDEEKYYEMVKEDEEIEKGLRVMRTFGKKPTSAFRKKIQEYKNRKRDI